MTTKQRSRKFRREQAGKDKAKRGQKATALRAPKSEVYDRNKRVAIRAQLRQADDWGWS